MIVQTPLEKNKGSNVKTDKISNYVFCLWKSSEGRVRGVENIVLREILNGLVKER